MLKITHLSKRYGSLQALDSLSFDVGAHELVGFVGANGAGKSTTMRIIMGVLEGDGGTVTWNGAPVDAAARRRIGYMPEERGLYPKMKVGGQLTYLARLHGADRAGAERAAQEWTERLGLAERRGDDVQKLSLGNQQRVQLAAALIGDPGLLILDEPFSGLDPVAVDVMSEVLRERAAAGVPALFSSHQLDVVERLCDRIVIIRSGRLVAAGTIEELRATAAPHWRVVVDVDAAPDEAAEAADEAVRTEAQAGADGTWRVANADGAITKGAQFQWEVEVYVPSTGKVETNTVTDPYSVALTTDSTRSVAIDLSDGALAPAQWASTPAPKVRNDASRAIYELHVRDFSAKDQSVPEEMRGTYKAFTVSGSAGMTHLGELAGAGMNTVHLLPTFDIATIPEKRAEQKTPQIPEGAGPASEEQQAAVSAVADEDAFNWGYDPLHWMAPEGSYATDANQNGGGRTVEFREMVGALHATGLQVVLDQVYNHTAASGQDAKSVLDRIVPGYYQRLNASGGVENSTCCSNVATENAMSERLMIDSLVMWARHYHVDGFRFDLMGHHSRQTMERAKAALSQLTLEADGVDGSSLYLYGEGWNFGEVANNALFTQATQGQLDGTGIGAFNDRLRDAVHGGGPFDEDHRVYQGFGSGAFSDPNGLDTRSEAERQADYQHRVDLVKIGLTGNLKGYAMTTYDGRAVTGEQLDYNGQGAGYASQPAESVNYVDAHDNETLFDLLTYKLPTSVPMGDRVRMNTLSLATVALGQSPSFWSSGTEILRSKSLDRDSFNSGDHFNSIDWTGQDNGFGAGLPVASKNGDKWPIMRPLLEDASLKPAPADIASAKGQALDLLRLRASTPLFALGSAELIGQKVTFPDSGAAPGSLTMLVDDTVGADADPALDGVLAVFNASDKPLTQTVGALAGRPFQLSDVQAGGSDEVVKGATFDAATGTLTVPARTVAVFTQATGGVGPQPLTGQWMKDGSRWWYRYSDGTYPSSTRLTIDGADYAFDAQGWMVTGWDSTDGQWRYYGSSGAAVSGWLCDGGSWYYLDPATKAMATGWLELGGTWYHLVPSGAMATGWARVDGQWYHFGPSGAMDRGWLYVRGSWFYLTDSGAMAIGWVPVGGSWYYMHASGVMATGTQVIDGTTYRFSSSGRWIG